LLYLRGPIPAKQVQAALGGNPQVPGETLTRALDGVGARDLFSRGLGSKKGRGALPWELLQVTSDIELAAEAALEGRWKDAATLTYGGHGELIGVPKPLGIDHWKQIPGGRTDWLLGSLIDQAQWVSMRVRANGEYANADVAVTKPVFSAGEELLTGEIVVEDVLRWAPATTANLPSLGPTTDAPVGEAIGPGVMLIPLPIDAQDHRRHSVVVIDMPSVHPGLYRRHRRRLRRYAAAACSLLAFTAAIVLSRTDWGPAGSGRLPAAAASTDGPPGATVVLARGPAAPVGYRYAVTVRGFPAGDAVTIICRDSVTPGGFNVFTLATDRSGRGFTASYCYSDSGPDHWVTAGGAVSNHVTWGPTFPEVPGGSTRTFTAYLIISDKIRGPSLRQGTTVQISCKVIGFRVADGDTWWYRVASPPWSDRYYASADAFYNNDQSSGSLIGTSFVDPRVPPCTTSRSRSTAVGYSRSPGARTQ
jgi:hypothetical protein